MKVVLLARAASDAATTDLDLAQVLHEPSSATSLRRQGAGLALADGPSTDAAEQVVALEEIEVDDLDEAIRRAAGSSAARVGTVEVRRVHEGPDDGVPPALPAAGVRRYLLLHVLPTDPAAAPAVPPNGSIGDWLASPLVQRTVLAGNRLLDATVDSAAIVRVRDGETEVARGLPAAAMEVAGYDLISARDLDEVIEVARPHPTLTWGVVEIRPLVMA